jgi:hypothetical protein
LSDLHEGIGVPRPRALLPLLALFGCPSEPEPATCATGEPATWVIRELTFARRVDGVVEGFDIDGHDSSAQGDALGCGHPDLAAESLVKQSIASGELLLLLSVDGVRSWEGDDCVDFTLSRGDGVPLVGPDGTLLDHQTLVLDPSVAAVQVDGVIDQGRLDADGLSFRLPLDVLNAELDFEVTRGRFALERRGDRLRGVMGGVIPIRQIVEILERDDVNLDQFIPFVEGVADVQDDDGDCSLLSLAFEFEAIPAYIAP